MGCDIHFVVEHKGPEDDEWMGVYSTDLTPRMRAVESQPDVHGMGGFKRRPVFKERNYDFFGLLAGVRRESEVRALGMPEDASALSRRCINRWDTDGHSHSHCTLEHFALMYACSTGATAAVVAAELQQDKGRKKALLDDLLGEYNDYQDYRVVFWFDN
jgi:hypothetical protein